jgi:hypothetical protein
LSHAPQALGCRELNLSLAQSFGMLKYAALLQLELLLAALQEEMVL